MAEAVRCTQGGAGFAAEIQVNLAVKANPPLVVNGNIAIAGSATGAAAFTPQPGRRARRSFTTLIAGIYGATT